MTDPTTPAAVDPQQEPGGDALARVQAFTDAWTDVPGMEGLVAGLGIPTRLDLTIDDLRAVVAELKQRRDESGTVWLVERNEQLRNEVERLREHLAALNEAQVGLQTSAFKAGWWSCRDAVTTNVIMPMAEAHALHYAEQIRAAMAVAPQQPEPSDGAR